MTQPAIKVSNGIIGSEKKKTLRCCLCDETLSSNSWLEHIATRKHARNIKNFNATFVNQSQTFHCKKCSKNFDWKTLKSHAAEHKISPWYRPEDLYKIFFENQIIEWFAKFYCFPCDEIFLNWSDAFVHTNAVIHKNQLEAKEPRNKSLNLSETGLYYEWLVCDGMFGWYDEKIRCKICDFHSCDIANFDGHIEGSRHNRERLKLFKILKPRVHDKVANERSMINDRVTLIKNEIYWCNFCQCLVDGMEKVSSHITQHESARWRLSSVKQPIRDELTKNPLDGASSELKSQSHYYMIENGDEKLRCTICNNRIMERTDIKAHVTSDKHVTGWKKFRDNAITLDVFNKYYCHFCKCYIHGFRNVYPHIDGSRHKYCRFDEKATNNIEKSSNSERSTKANDVIIDEKSLSPNLIVQHSDVDYYCAICDFAIIDRIDVKDHITSKKHVKDREEFRDNEIIFKEDQYYCSFCNCKIFRFDDVSRHIRGYRHNAAKSESQESPESREILKDVRKRKFPYQYIAESKDSYLGTFNDNNIECTDKNVYYCKYCDIMILGNASINEHIKGTRHHSSLQVKVQPKDIGPGVSMTNYPQDLNPQVTKLKDTRTRNPKVLKSDIGKPKDTKPKNPKVLIKPDFHKSKDSKDLYPEIQTPADPNPEFSKPIDQKSNNPKNLKPVLPNPENLKKKHIRNLTKLINCNICNFKCANFEKLHSHLAGHFSKEVLDFNDVPRDNKENNDNFENKSSMNLLNISTDSIDTLTCETENLKLERTTKILNMKKIAKTLNFHNNDIYNMSDKLREYELGTKLSYAKYTGKMYCLVCRITTEFTSENYLEHLCNLDHCIYLEMMERDHASFHEFPKQFSDIDLGLEYIEDISKNRVHCHVCDLMICSNDDVLAKHIKRKSHARHSRILRDEAMTNFELIKLSIDCDWYKVAIYRCVPCLWTFKSEVTFYEHMRSKEHLEIMEKPVNKKWQLVYDFCKACALLWYGYRRTCAYHREIDTHLWLIRDGYYLSEELPLSVKELLSMPEFYVNETIMIYEETIEEKREKEVMLIRDMELAVGRKYFRAKAHMFGSRVTGMGSLDCDIDVFLDCGNMYNGKMESRDMILNTIMDDVSECLNQEPKSWIVQELVKTCRSPIIRAHHRPTGLSCDISFENGLGVENTNLIKSYNDAYPLCREMIIFLKGWLNLCKLSSSDGITSYALYWHVIFYLQHETILPSVEELIKIKNQSRTIDGWEVGATRDFTQNLAKSNFTIRQLLMRFFDFWSKFDHRYDVACPMIGKILKKRDFLDYTIISDDKSFYVDHVKKSMSREALRIDSPMCLQDPFDLRHNITKAVGKVLVNRFRKYCTLSLDALMQEENQACELEQKKKIKKDRFFFKSTFMSRIYKYCKKKK